MLNIELIFGDEFCGMLRKMHFTVAIIATLLFSTNAFAQSQKGFFIGKVTSENGSPMVDVLVSISNTEFKSSTDVEGKVQIELPVGSYLISAVKSGFEIEEDTFVIEEGKTTYGNFTMIKTEKIGETRIFGKVKEKPSTVADAVKTKILSVQVVEAISAEDFSKTTIRTTSDALKRIPGATISEGKFANVRGMFDRYNAGYLNGAPLPSTESDRKAFSFDVIPAGLLDNIVVIKSGTPDLIGDFGGGIIKINTKSIPEKKTQNISFGFQYNSITTNNPVRSFDVGSMEYFGGISKSNQIPTLDPRMHVDYVNPEVNIAETKKFNNDWSLKPMNASPSPRFSYTLGVPFKIKKMQAGVMVSWNYAMTQKFSYGRVDSRDYSDNHKTRGFKDSNFSTNVQNGGVVNFALKINNKNKIDFKNLISYTYDAASTIRHDSSDIDNNMGTDGFSSLKNLNKLYSSQLIGSHSIGKNNSAINWVLNYGFTNRLIPDFRISQYGYSYDDPKGTRMLAKTDFFRDAGRFFSSLNENFLSGSADYSTNLNTGKIQTTLKAGVYLQHRTRSFNARQFVYGPITNVTMSTAEPQTDLGIDKIGKSLFLIEKTSSKDDYTAFSRLEAAYLMFENLIPFFKVGKKNYDIKLLYGVRMEQFKQILKNKEFSQMGRYLATQNPKDSIIDILPSITAIIPISKKSNFRAAFYKTVNRPELRELAPFAFYNFSINSEILGYPQLTTAQINNLDLRWELFSNKEDIFSVGYFVKVIKNPIEFSLDPTQTQIRTFTYQNQNVANNNGFEIELRKNFASFSKFLPGRFWKNFTFYGNYAWIQSLVKFKDFHDSVKTRPLQGQSPYVINLSLFYENKNGLQVNVSFNKIGQRIAYIGLPSNNGKFGVDIYEFGRSILDLQVAKKLGKNGLIRLTMGDLLAQKTVFYQDMNKNGKYDEAPVKSGGDNTLISFTNGRTVTIGYSLNF